MKCLICHSDCKSKLCKECNTFLIYDSKYNFIRRRKRLQESISTGNKDYTNELLLYKNICNLVGKKLVYRNVHPIWARSDKDVLLEFDIVIPDKKILIEYDGIQHFIYPNFFHKSRDDFDAQLFRDKLKNKLAKINKWKLIRFNYKENIDDVNIRRKLECILP